MRIVLAVMILTVAPAFAQNPAAACGPAGTAFKVKLDKSLHSVEPPDAGRARIYFIHDAATAGDIMPLTYPTVKMAMDGSWVGANRGNSFFQVDASPGEHHFCAVLQTSFLDPRVELAHLIVEAGKTYFYRTQLLLSGEVDVLELDPVDSDEGRYLVSTFPMSLSKARH
ncbi:MAG: hypothetical protein WCF17_08905 [Terracidiphilus sp.]